MGKVVINRGVETVLQKILELDDRLNVLKMVVFNAFLNRVSVDFWEVDVEKEVVVVLKTVVRRENDAKNEVETTNDNSAEKVVC